MSNEEITINLTNNHKDIIQRLRAGGKLFYNNVPPGFFILHQIGRPTIGNLLIN